MHIQIQLLLKLNSTNPKLPPIIAPIQIQLLLKLNLPDTPYK